MAKPQHTNIQPMSLKVRIGKPSAKFVDNSNSYKLTRPLKKRKKPQLTTQEGLKKTAILRKKMWKWKLLQRKKETTRLQQIFAL